MKKTLFVLILSFLIISSCSSTPSVILDETYYLFSLGFEGKEDRSRAFGNQLELVATYSSNEKGNILENSQITVNGYDCSINSINPQSFQLGQDLKVSISCSESFEESQINGSIVLEYLQGSTQRLAQGEFLLTVED